MRIHFRSAHHAGEGDSSARACGRIADPLPEVSRRAAQITPGVNYAMELEGFPIVHLEWVPVVQTAGALLLPPFVHHPGRSGPELLSILMNGLESREDLSALVKRFRCEPTSGRRC